MSSSPVLSQVPSTAAIPRNPSSTGAHFLSGLSGGVVSAVLLQPADLLKTRVQQSHSSSLRATLREIYDSPHPVRTLWRGTVPSALRTGIGSALYFSSLNSLRSYVAASSLTPTKALGNNVNGNSSSSTLPKLGATANLLTGALARASVGFVMMPITIIKVRYESSFYAYPSIVAATASIFRSEGLAGFFSGWGATAIRDAPYAGLYVLFYETSKTQLSLFSTKAGTENLSTSAATGINLVSGLVAGATATAITNPFDALKTRIQIAPKQYRNLATAAATIWREEGWRSFFDGLALRMSRKAISSAFAWTVYEEGLRQVEQARKRRAERLT